MKKVKTIYWEKVIEYQNYVWASKSLGVEPKLSVSEYFGISKYDSFIKNEVDLTVDVYRE